MLGNHLVYSPSHLNFEISVKYINSTVKHEDFKSLSASKASKVRMEVEDKFRNQSI